MKNNKILLFTLLSILVTQQLFSQNINKENYRQAFSLFTKFENKLKQDKKAYDKRKQFFSPADESVLFLNVLKQEAPELYDHTKLYSNSLFKILEKTDFVKHKEFNLDIVRVLYHLNIVDYVNVVNKIYCKCKKDKMDIRILINCLITCDNHYSNLVVLNYKSENLQSLLINVLNDEGIVKKAIIINSNFVDIIRSIKDGELYKEFQTTDKDWFFVYQK